MSMFLQGNDIEAWLKRQAQGQERLWKIFIIFFRSIWNFYICTFPFIGSCFASDRIAYQREKNARKLAPIVHCSIYCRAIPAMRSVPLTRARARGFGYTAHAVRRQFRIQSRDLMEVLMIISILILSL